MRTLLIDDDAGAQALLIEILRSRGHSVTVYGDTAAAWKAFARNPFPLVITDMLLPGKSGLELCRRIRQHSQSRNTTVLICTAAQTHEDLDAVLNAGADDYLPKPFNVEQFNIRIRIVEKTINTRVERQISEDSINRLLQHVTLSQESVIDKTLDGRIVCWNDRAAEMYGYSTEEAKGQPISFMLPDGRKDEIDNLLTGLLAGERVSNFETTRLHKRGELIDVSISMFLIRDQKNVVVGFTTVSRDITVQVKIQNELRLTDARSRHLFDSDMMGIVFWDMSGRLLDANDTFLRMIQYTRSDALTGNLHWSEITPPEWAELDKKANAQLVDSGRVQPYEKEFVRRDGVRIPVLVGPVIFEHSVTEGIAFILDLTARKQLERQLSQSSKMEAIGRLAGGIAHDFNNLLTVIIGRSELLADRIANNPEWVAEINLIKSTGEKAASLTRQLLQFSRKQLIQPKVLNLHSIVLEMMDMLHSLIGADIELVLLPSNASNSVKVDPSQMQQVVMNLCVNARDAMPQGGKLTIEIADVILGEEYLRHHPEVTPGPHVMLAVSDTGRGMDENTKAHLFEPFFTTKDLGKGTGLGLSTVFGIVKQSGGSIWVYSELKHGTTFKVYIPVTHEKKATISSTTLQVVHAGTARIMVVDDDENVLELIRDVLNELGYKVVAVNSPEEAIALMERENIPIDLLLTDVVMPKMSGKELVAKFSAVNPNIKVLFMSGYTNDAIVNHGILEEGIEFLEKPFTASSLSRKIHNVLNSTLPNNGDE